MAAKRPATRTRLLAIDIENPPVQILTLRAFALRGEGEMAAQVLLAFSRMPILKRSMIKPRSSKLADSAIVAGLIVSSLLLLLILNGVPQPGAPVRTIRNANGPADGFLLVVLGTNQDPKNPISDPSNSTLFPIAGKHIFILNQTDPSLAPRELVTNGSGLANSSLPPGKYVVRFDDYTVHPAIPVLITKGNATILGVRVGASLAPAIASEFSDLKSSGVAAEGSNYFLIHSAVRVANVSDSMVVKVRGPGASLQVANATVIGERLATGGLWLQMRILSELNLTASSGVDLTVYGYSYQSTTVPIKSLAA